MKATTMFWISGVLVWTLLFCATCSAAPAVEESAHPRISANEGWRPLFNGTDLAGWRAPPGSWAVEDGVIARKGGGNLVTIEQFGDFMLDLEFKIAPKTNSGIMIRVVLDPNVKPFWRDGLLEVQILDSHGKKRPDKHDCGAMYDLLAPSKNVVNKPGEWNRVTITAMGPKLTVVMNGRKIIDMDTNDWTESGKNPDGTPNKYKKPIKDLPLKGAIVLQDHGTPIWFRNVYIRRLD